MLTTDEILLQQKISILKSQVDQLQVHKQMLDDLLNGSQKFDKILCDFILQLIKTESKNIQTEITKLLNNNIATKSLTQLNTQSNTIYQEVFANRKAYLNKITENKNSQVPEISYPYNRSRIGL